ncbi:MAG: bifunctional riboflavin kinase/FAD synthetase [Terrimicrobiaceae bacterium]
MNILREIEALAGVAGPVVLAVGVFDGVHLGHQAVLARALADAERLGGTAVALTFDPHPAKFLRPGAAPRLLTATTHKLRLIGRVGIRHVLVLPFDARIASMEGCEFLEHLATCSNPLGGIVVGSGWRFGARRSGTVDLIREVGRQKNFEAVEIPAVDMGGVPVSSTRIRADVEAGNLAAAAACLGRPFEIFGTVVRGRQLGRQLGFPTANLHTHNEQFPPDGVYAGRAVHAHWNHACVVNIGLRPTVNDGTERTLEAHIPGFHGDLYGSELTVVFDRFLRSEKKFTSLDALKEQIRLDVAHAMAGGAPKPGS